MYKERERQAERDFQHKCLTDHFTYIICTQLRPFCSYISICSLLIYPYLQYIPYNNHLYIPFAIHCHSHFASYSPSLQHRWTGRLSTQLEQILAQQQRRLSPIVAWWWIRTTMPTIQTGKQMWRWWRAYATTAACIATQETAGAYATTSTSCTVSTCRTR